MLHHRAIDDGHHGLGAPEDQGAQPGALATRHDDRFHHPSCHRAVAGWLVGGYREAQAPSVVQGAHRWGSVALLPAVYRGQPFANVINVTDRGSPRGPCVESDDDDG